MHQVIMAEAARQMMENYSARRPLNWCWSRYSSSTGSATAYWEWRSEWIRECRHYIRNRAKEQVPSWLARDADETKT